MKSLRLGAAALVLLALVLAGCNGAVPTATRVSPAQASLGGPGTYEPFGIVLQNDSLWTIAITCQAAVPVGPPGSRNFNVWDLSGPRSYAGTVLIPAGGNAVIPFFFLPSSVFVEASTTAVPSQTFPAQVQTFGIDYGVGARAISFRFP